VRAAEESLAVWSRKVSVGEIARPIMWIKADTRCATGIGLVNPAATLTARWMPRVESVDSWASRRTGRAAQACGENVEGRDVCRRGPSA